MRPLIRSRVTRAATAATVAGLAGLVALVALGLFFAVGQPYGTINDVALAVMVAAIAPVMLGSYELGGVTPLWPARLSLAGGILGTIVFATVQVAMLLGVVTFDDANAATGAFLVENLALIVVGLWLAGAPPLAGPWIPGPLRWLGALAGIGFVLTGLGLILGGINHPLTWIGGVGYQLVFPVWAVLMAPVFTDLAVTTPAPAS